MTAPEQGNDRAESTSPSDDAAKLSTRTTNLNGENPPNGNSIPTVHIRELRQGHMPGERYVRIHRPFHETFREASSDTLVARESVFAPGTRQRSLRRGALALRILIVVTFEM